jgi:hypothetical protein
MFSVLTIRTRNGGYLAALIKIPVYITLSENQDVFSLYCNFDTSNREGSDHVSSGFDISGSYKTFSMCVNTTVDSLKEC